MSEKLARKEIREPDPFVRATRAYWGSLVEHRRLVGALLGGVVAVFLVAAIASHRSQKREEAAGAALSAALQSARRGVEGVPEPGADPEEPKFKSAKERGEQLAAQLAKVRADFPRTAAGRTAALYQGDALYQAGRLDEAARAFSDFAAASPKEDPLRPLALEGLGYVQESKGDWAKALELFGEMGAEPAGEPTRARAAFHRARILEESGERQKAAAAFEELKAQFKDSPSARAASERLAMLAAQGIEPAAGAPKAAAPALAK